MDKDEVRGALALVLFIASAVVAGYAVSDYFSAWLHHHPLVAWSVSLYCFARMLAIK